MQTQAVFHLLPEQAGDKALIQYACIMAASCYQHNQKVYIYTDNQQLAHDVDELLWSFDPESFIPHNLVGEGPRQGSPVEIGWHPPIGRRPVLINLCKNMPNFAGQFTQIIDFVPSATDEKQLARERFKACRKMGFQVDTQTPN